VAHPFFDLGTYPWHRADAINFFNSLYRVIYLPQRIDLIYKQCGRDLSPLALTDSPDMIWKRALEQLAAARKLRELCEIVRQEQSLAALATVVATVFDATEALKQLVLPQELNGDRAFLDRQTLRAGLQQIASKESSVGVLLVRGDPGSGRTWTRFLVESIAEEIGESPVLYIYEGNVYDARSVLHKIFGALGKPKEVIPPQNTSPTAWFIECLQTMQDIAIERAKERGRPPQAPDRQRQWIVVDDLGETENGPKLDLEIRSFFQAFVLQMADATFSQYFRLVLIEYPKGPVPTKWKKGFWLEDDTGAAAPRAEFLAEFLQQWGQYKGKGLPAEEADRLSTDILLKVRAQGDVFVATDWERVHQELLLVLEGL
jgi:hypothetical protein